MLFYSSRSSVACANIVYSLCVNQVFMQKLFQHVINNCESPVLFGLSEGQRGTALTLTACAVSSGTLYRGGGGAEGTAKEGRRGYGRCAATCAAQCSATGLQGATGGQGKKPKTSQGRTEIRPPPLCSRAVSAGGWPRVPWGVTPTLLPSKKNDYLCCVLKKILL